MNRREFTLAASAVAFAPHALADRPFRVIVRMPGTEKDQRDFGWVMRVVG